MRSCWLWWPPRRHRWSLLEERALEMCERCGRYRAHGSLRFRLKYTRQDVWWWWCLGALIPKTRAEKERDEAFDRMLDGE